jgi:hypothetical protein
LADDYTDELGRFAVYPIFGGFLGTKEYIAHCFLYPG